MSKEKIRDIFGVKLDSLFDKVPQGKVGRAKTEDIVGHLSNDQLVKALDEWFQNVYNFAMEYHAFRNTGHHGSLDALRKASRELRWSFRNPILYMVMLRQNMSKVTAKTNKLLSGALCSKNTGHMTRSREALKLFNMSEELWNKEFVYKRPELSTVIHRKRKKLRLERAKGNRELKKK